MAPPGGHGASGGGGGDGIDHQSAKHLLDSIGEKVHKKVHSEADAKKYKDELKGQLSQVSVKLETVNSNDTCNLVQKYYEHTNGDGKGKRYPCKGLSAINVERFSDTLGGQCTDSKMRRDGIGACAPYRRLHLCHHNLESIDTTSTTHDLLLEVCMAAYYEGDSIKTPYPKHERTNEGTASQLCTVLARSFADIGDIIRGRDPFYGNTHESKQREKLEENLQKIFKQIHDNLKDKEAEKHYKGDTDKNYYKLREYWWALNRQDVWKAITCGAGGSQYFRGTCGDGNSQSQATKQCRCSDKSKAVNGEVNIVPTYFDYVPQFLRWFEEWAEDFCRLRKHKLENAKSKCREQVKDSKKLYCDLNRYDCEQTASGKHVFFEEDVCKDCHFSCARFVKWIDNQKLEFLKQKKKYGTEISDGGAGGKGRTRKKRSTKSETYEGYDKDFYDILKKSAYNNVDKFLEKLNDEDVCKKNNEIEEGGKIDFKEVKSSSGKNSSGDINNKTFYRTTYCEACPWCGAEKVNGQNGKWKWEAKKGECAKEVTKEYNEHNTTTIPVLTPEEGQSGILKKYSKFCKNGANGEKSAPGKNDNQIVTWQCYYDKDEPNSKNNNNCVEGTWDTFTQGKKVKPYNPFFWDWVHDMLHDSVEWKTELDNCINNESKPCKKNNCNDKCKCYESWVQQKKTEWEKIVQHFKNQTDIREEGLLAGFMKHDIILEQVLKDGNLLQNIKDTHVDADDIERIEALLEKEKKKTEGTPGGAPGTEQKSIIVELLKHEGEEAEKCKENNAPEKCQPKKLKNPCSGESGNKLYPVLAEKVAQILQGEVRAKMLERSGDNGESKLKADATKGEYTKEGKGENLNSTFCNINETYSNSTEYSEKPCGGKDNAGERFQVGTEWQTGTDVQMSHTDLYLPPRREHMCTSNLEKLNVGDVTNNGNVNDTFLGNVLLAANYEAKKIKDVYQENKHSSGQNEKNGLNNEKTVCRAMKYSFADIGDIIKGTDLWDANGDATGVQNNLKDIFSKITEELKKQHPDKFNDNDKYVNDNEGKHTQLRSDWWEANRDQVWEAMKCKTKSHPTIKCDKESTPLDDYIPQRLRWMTEWAEWYCKAQKKEYDELMGKCGICMSMNNGNGGQGCTSGDVDSVKKCKTCKAACEKYKEEINKWKKQWNTMSYKYLTSYWQAKKPHAGFSFHGAGADYEQMVDFLTPIHKASIASSRKGVEPTTSPYETAAGYIHQELGKTVGCDTQTQFCKEKNGITSSGTENKDYVFREKPKDHDEACECKPPKPTGGRGPGARSADTDGHDDDKDDEGADSEGDEEEEEEEEEEEDPQCKTVNDILSTDDRTKQVGQCNAKIKNINEGYPDWTCVNSKFENNEDGPCMPPRRQKLCLYYLKELKDHTENDLREAFIRTAAAETFLSWQYYKIKNGADAKQLDNGTIPEEFLRSMYFTYGDYRDICLDKDISKKSPGSDVNTAKTNIDNVFKSAESRETWWNENGPKIWEGMLCALTNGVNETKKKKYILEKYEHNKVTTKGNQTLEKFAEKPQFLRWMIEWGEEFCRERQKKENIIKDACNEKNSTQQCNDVNHPCNKACRAYQEYVENKKKEFLGQTTKFVRDANLENADPEYNDYKLKEGPSKQGNEYLLEKCDKRKCDCMQGNVRSYEPKDAPFGKYSSTTLKLCDCTGGIHKPEASPARPPPPPAPVVTVDVCPIVKTALTTPGNLTQACSLKYVTGKNYGWKCVSSGVSTTTSGDQKATGSEGSDAKGRHRREADPATSSDNKGGLCIPPRRRKLYVGKLHDWASGNTQAGGGETTEAKSQETSETSSAGGQKTPSDKLRTAFIQSAAVETFFLWDRYKQEKKKPQNGLVGGVSLHSQEGSPEDDPQIKLNGGDIPDDFLRQMFYTLGDYRDICVDNVPSGIDTVSASGDNPTNKVTMKEISDKIKEMLKKQSGEQPPPDKNPGQTPQEWWKANGEHIWKGMLCALTYTDSEQKGGTPQKVEAANGTDLFQKLKTQYEYNTVTLKEDESGAKSTDPTRLSEFVKRPFYFRWLQEWGEEFCATRKRMLEQVEKNCTQDGDKQYSGFGENCKDQLSDDPSNFPDLGYSCPKSCRLYKKWIEKKKEEFTEQENAYDGQKTKCKEESGGGVNGFCETLQENAAQFLERLGPCKKDNSEDNGNDKLNFSQPNQTFKEAHSCAPCSQFKINCNNSHCKVDQVNTCKNNKITAENIQNKTNGNGNIEMLVSDNNSNGFEHDLKEACQHANIFKGIRKDVWKCGKVCGYVVCKPVKVDGIENQNKIITIRGLVEHWVHNFLEDYNRIRKKLKACMKNGKGSTCTSDCGKKCDCVKEWIGKKRAEWETIRGRFNEQYKNETDEYFNVKSFLETLIPQIAVTDVQNKIIKLSKFDNPCGCSFEANSQNKNGHKDAIDCMLKKLKDKIDECKDKHSGNQQQPCQESPPELDEEDLLLEETENQVEQPNICPQLPKPQAEDEHACKTDAPQPDVKEEEEEKKEEKDKGNDQEGRAPPPPATDTRPVPSPLPPQADEPFDPTILQTTIPLGIALALGSIAFLFLKKKTKSSVANLFQILQIPKGDHDIPTLKSKNRYIPYRSGTYKGKTYIYMEGDSSGDEKYAFMSDTTDITSSESEYEEMDINDIYAPRAPKYKTLIEVVLEPSKRDIQSDDIPNNDIHMNKFTDDEWNKLKKDFISNMLQNTQNTEPNILRDNVDNNTNTTMSRDNMEEKPFIMSIHDRNLFSGEEISYNVNMVNSMNDIPMSGKNDVYSGIDLINDSLNSDQHIDIYDEVLKRKENELFGTNNTKKNTSTNSASKLTNSDPITNQLELFHKWLDRHRHMCDQWNKNKKEELLDELKEEWNKENNNSSAKTYNSDNKPSHNHVLNTDVSIQIDMDNLKPKNEFTNMDTNPDKSTMDTILDDLEKYNEPYYYDFYKDDIYYDVNDDDKTSMDNNNNLVDKNNPVDSNNSTYNHRNPADINKNFVDKNNQNQHPIEKPTKIQIEMNINNGELVKEKYPISDIWNI
ncbi:erythrocyte membrane protein 1 var IT-ICAM [Plasmodium falciparum IGH-CR14]|uniref:Erythrocyte membrane protein 1 var IT-ICAM n=2 Tax=Plasmodium falciparum TaxID=5833 RepID=A0A0L1I3C4_PLAFA|nr:erythrocyte membrane protein 1 var IT-ICAM [Plasmodium falciparum IGH-CR14]